MTDFRTEALLKLRDYFIRTDELAGVEIINVVLFAQEQMPKSLILTEQDAKAILEYFYNEAGYISYETEKLEIRNVIRKLEDHFYGPRRFKPVIQGKD